MKDRANEIARTRKYDGYQITLASMIYIFVKEAGPEVSANEN